MTDPRGPRVGVRILLISLALAAVIALVAQFPRPRSPSPSPSALSPTSETIRTVANPGRGQYLWHPDDHPSALPPGTEAVDSYARITWREIERDRGHFDFDAIDRQLDMARERGGLFAFRIMAVCSSCDGKQILPDDLETAGRTWTVTLDDGTRARLPDWNDDYFLSRWEALMARLGARYGNDPRLGYLDVGGYGNWGEGHNWPYERRYPGPSGQQQGFPDSQTQIALSVIRNFPNKFVLYTPPSVTSDEDKNSNSEAAWGVFRNILLASRKVGIRNDCLGGGSVQKWALDGLIYAQSQAIAEDLHLEDRPLDRWRIAPFVSEWCKSIRPQSDDGTFTQGLQQVQTYHISAVSNANFTGDLASYPEREQRSFALATARSGYDFQVHRTNPPRGDANRTIELAWENYGVAPTYLQWKINYTVIAHKSGSRCQVESGFDLRKLIQKGDTGRDAFDVPPECADGGDIGLRVKVISTAEHIRPMRLSAGTENPDGSFNIDSTR